MKQLLTAQQSKFFWIGLIVLAITSALFYFIIPLLGIDHQSMSFKQFIYHSLWRILTTGFFLFLLLRFFDKRLELKRKALDETFQRYEALSKASNDAIWDYDNNTGEVYYNEKVSEIFGYTREELHDNHKWWEENIHPMDKVRVIEKMKQYLAGQATSWEDEYQFACANGIWKTVYDRSYIIRNEEGKPLRLIGAMKDVTLLREMEKELHKQQLRDKNIKGQRIIRSNEEERKKIREELHEDVNQILASIKMHMAGITSIANKDSIVSSMQHLDAAIRKIRKISNTLSSATFEMMGLSEAINELILVQYSSSPVTMIFTDIDFNEEIIQKEVALLLYRIIEHELFRITEYSKTNKIDIRLTNNEERSILIISFHSPDGEISRLLNDIPIQELRGKLEMYEGTLAINQLPGNNYTIVATI